MHISSIEITGINGIESLAVKFNDSFNVICGPNGVGKSTILECISSMFSRHEISSLKRNARHTEGGVRLNVISENTHEVIEASITEFNPAVSIRLRNTRNPEIYKLTRNILYFKLERGIPYISLQAITRDPEKNANNYSNDCIQGIGVTDLKNWFVNRVLWSKHDHFSPSQKSNLELAQSIFSRIDSNLSFHRIKPDTYDIMLMQGADSEIYFEYLSSGYKSIVYMILSIIKEVEYRFKDPYMTVSDFQGVILIDELDLHLHPTWQRRVIEILREIAPQAQFITTTHSPHILQAVEQDEIISLGFTEHGAVDIIDLGITEFGLKGWTIEEILTDVMKMNTVFASDYNTLVRKFDEALDSEDVATATDAFEVINRMLHPRNPLRKMFQLQLSSISS